MTNCVVCPGAKPKEADEGKLVCFTCSNRILRLLRELEEYLPALSLFKTVSGGDTRKKGFGSSSPANDTAIHHTDWRTNWSALDVMGASDGSRIDVWQPVDESARVAVAAVLEKLARRVFELRPAVTGTSGFVTAGEMGESLRRLAAEVKENNDGQ